VGTHLRNRIRRVRGNFVVQVQPVRLQAIRGPDGRILAVEAQRIGIMPIDVHTCWRVGRDITEHMRLVVEVRHHDTRVLVLLCHSLPIFDLRHGVRSEGMLVLVLRLEENDRAAVGDLCLSNDSTDLGGVVVRRVEEVGIRRPECATDFGHPAWEPAARYLSVDVWTWSCEDV
jgi:hypothetical protein